jgi:transglutaminase-like putative cysteine protease
MKITVRHETLYTYSRPVRLAPHLFRLHPRLDGALRLLDQQLHLEPEPVGQAPCLDAEGNVVVNAWFDAMTERLRIVSRFEVETLRQNPFEYLLGLGAERLPLRYDEGLEAVLAGYCTRQYQDGAVAAFAHGIAADCGSRTLEFLAALNRRIQETCPGIIREEGWAHPPEHTLRVRTGSCRDVAVVFIEACRAVGIAARFVSGYQTGALDRGAQRYMHAWAEVFLPGGGWRGYDPTQGIAIADQHVAVAASRESRHATPIEGAFQGAGATSTIEADIELH